MITTPPMNPLITVLDLCFDYEKSIVLKDISLNIYEGEYIALLGPNGGGKTTLIKLLLGIIKPAKGAITHNTQPKIGYIPQRLATNIHFPATVREILESGGDSKTANSRSIFQKFNLQHLLHKTLDQLSGGERQKVFVARCLVSNPQLIILDEPTVGIDQQSQDEFWSLLRELHQVQKIGIILISHDIAEVTRDATRILYLNQTLEHDNPSLIKLNIGHHAH